ncbi:uncharacterized protein LOC111084228, partial [Limulus polyphemus]|uniref:Uncharacterized protein LOC111084228 n=1 Tax=Limulus polyphemus TaxID=6850 RepID=A0ABM1RZA0_LIMPO
MDASSGKFDTQGIKRGQSEVSEPESRGSNEAYCPSQIPFITGYLHRDSKRKHTTENRPTSSDRELSGTKFMRTLVETRSRKESQLDEKCFAPTKRSKASSEPPEERCLTSSGGLLPYSSCHMRGRFSEPNYTNIRINTFTFSAETSSVLSEYNQCDQKNPVTPPNPNHNPCLCQGLSHFETVDSPTCKSHPVVTQDSGYISLADTGHFVCGSGSTLLDDVFLEEMGIFQDSNKLSCELHVIKNASQKTSEVSKVYWSNSNNLIRDEKFEKYITGEDESSPEERHNLDVHKKYITGEDESSPEERHNLDVQYSIMADEDGD